MLEDRSALYGDALFETVRVEQPGPIALDRHISRFSRSAQALGFDAIAISDGIAALMSLVTAAPGIHRVTVSRRAEGAPFGGQGSVWITVRELPTEFPRPRVTLLPDWYFPLDTLAEHKTTSYIRRVEQRRRALLLGYDDAISVSPDGLIGEASTANIFVEFPSGICTPPAQGILPGVTRERILERFDVLVRPIRADELEFANEIVLTNSVQTAVPALDLNGRSLGHYCAQDFIEALG